MQARTSSLAGAHWITCYTCGQALRRRTRCQTRMQRASDWWARCLPRRPGIPRNGLNAGSKRCGRGRRPHVGGRRRNRGGGGASERKTRLGDQEVILSKHATPCHNEATRPSCKPSRVRPSACSSRHPAPVTYQSMQATLCPALTLCLYPTPAIAPATLRLQLNTTRTA